MKKLIILLICLTSFTMEVQANSYCVLGDDDNTVIEEKNMHERQSVASISKIMTAIIAIEQDELGDTWNVSNAVMKAHGSSIYLQKGQKVSMQSLLYGLLLRSGNDAAVEIATRVSGSEEAFVKEMNRKAEKIGMKNTIFHNASGLDDEGEGNISTAYDMAILMSYAMKNDIFRTICGSKYYTSEWNYRWKNKNRLLFDYPFTTGGKTGFTKHAGRTLVTSASNQQLETVVVTLGVPDDFKFHEQKHTEAFAKMKAITVLKKGTYHAGNHIFTIKQDIRVLTPREHPDEIEASAEFKKNKLVVKVRKNDITSTYRITARKKPEKSFWKRVIPWI